MSHPYFHINTPAEIFADQMRWLSDSGYRSINLTEALNGLRDGVGLQKTVVITFDDGYRDFYTHAMPALKQHGFHATVFLATDRIRTSPVCLGRTDFLTWRDVRELQAEGISFGSHTVTHPYLQSLEPNRIEYEVGRSKEVLEDRVGIAIEGFAHPHGFPEEDRNYTSYLENVLCKYGYDHGVSTILGRASSKSNRFFLPRLPVNGLDDRDLFVAKLEGGYDWLHWPQLLKKKLIH